MVTLLTKDTMLTRQSTVTLLTKAVNTATTYTHTTHIHTHTHHTHTPHHTHTVTSLTKQPPTYFNVQVTRLIFVRFRPNAISLPKCVPVHTLNSYPNVYLHMPSTATQMCTCTCPQQLPKCVHARPQQPLPSFTKIRPAGADAFPEGRRTDKRCRCVVQNKEQRHCGLQANTCCTAIHHHDDR